MQKQTLIVSPQQDGLRCDVFLAQALPDFTRNAAQNLLNQGHVALGDKILDKKEKMVAGQEISVCLPDPKPDTAQPQNIPLSVLYEDADVIVIDKEKGMVVHPAAGNEDGTLVNALLAHCGDSLSGIGGTLRPGIVHRIDKDTSGLLIVAKNDAAHRALAAQLEDHSLFRQYEALVLGTIKQPRGSVDAPIGRSQRDRKKMAVVPQGGRRAVTHYEVLGHYPGYTHITCQLETGRTHQIRVHMAHIGHPIAGDTVYGNRGDSSGLSSQCLHARRLTFVHPTSGESITVESPLPEYFTAFLEKLARRNG